MPTASSRLERNPAFRRLKSLLQQPGPLTLAQRHEIGQQVEQLCPDRRYGEGTMSGLAEALGRPESFATSLLAMRKFAEVSRRTEVVRLSKPAPSGFQLRWSHFILLLSLPPKQRLAFQRRCIANEWSVRTLHQRIKLKREPRRWGGRRHQRPEDLQTALRQLIDAGQSWRRRCHDVWFHENMPAISSEGVRGAEGRVQELRSEAVSVLKEMRAAIDMALPVLEPIRRSRRQRSGSKPPK